MLTKYKQAKREMWPLPGNDQWALYKTSEVLSIPGAMGLLIAIKDRGIEVPRLYSASIGAT